MFLAGEEWAARFEAFKAGARIDPQAVSNEYTDRLRRQAAEGRIQGRVHIVTRPLTDYLKFEFAQYYAPHALAGEQIRILDVTDRDNPLVGVQDFWMFDPTEVVLMHYEADGTQIPRIPAHCTDRVGVLRGVREGS